MINIMTGQKLRVSTIGSAGPFIDVPLKQLGEVQSLLSRHGVYHYPNETAVALDGKNFVTVINLGRNGDADKVQRILDAAESLPTMSWQMVENN